MWVLGKSPILHYSYTYSTVIGVCGKDGVVLGVEKLISSKLHEITSNRRLFTADKHIGIVSGLYVHVYKYCRGLYMYLI